MNPKHPGWLFSRNFSKAIPISNIAYIEIASYKTGELFEVTVHLKSPAQDRRGDDLIVLDSFEDFAEASLFLTDQL